MGMYTFVRGFREPDEKWLKMKAVWEACEEAATDIPDDVIDFFDDEEPDEAGITVDLEEHECCKKYEAEGDSGYEIDISKLPKNITKIRFYNSW